MEAATAERPEIATETVTFLSPCRNLRLVRKAETKIYNFNGLVVDGTPSESVDFVDGRVALTDEGQIKWMREHWLYNLPKHGFYEQGNPPNAPKPSTKDQMAAIVRATATHDAALLLEVVNVERATHKREEVLLAAETATDAIEQARAATVAKAAAEAEALEAAAVAETERKAEEEEAAAEHERLAQANGNGDDEQGAEAAAVEPVEAANGAAPELASEEESAG